MNFAFDMFSAGSPNAATIDALGQAIRLSPESPPVRLVDWVVQSLASTLINEHGCPGFITLGWGNGVGREDFPTLLDALQRIGDAGPAWNVEGLSFGSFLIFNGLGQTSEGLAQTYASNGLAAVQEDLKTVAAVLSKTALPNTALEPATFLVVCVAPETSQAQTALGALRTALSSLFLSSSDDESQ